MTTSNYFVLSIPCSRLRNLLEIETDFDYLMLILNKDIMLLNEYVLLLCYCLRSDNYDKHLTKYDIGKSKTNRCVGTLFIVGNLMRSRSTDPSFSD